MSILRPFELNRRSLSVFDQSRKHENFKNVGNFQSLFQIDSFNSFLIYYAHENQTDARRKPN